MNYTMHCLTAWAVQGCALKYELWQREVIFIRVCNALYSKVGRLTSEKVGLSLIRAKMRLMRVHYSHVTGIRLNLLWLLHSLNCFALSHFAVAKCCQLVFNFLAVHSQLGKMSVNIYCLVCSFSCCILYFVYDLIINNKDCIWEQLLLSPLVNRSS